ncbi:Pre-mRNA cleavage complex 2 protein Pcf11 [Dissostichus eleginoides]|uniref:Pre-mRNA cleavage complex 2 protein Pcf11 n=1 Tax=Dissostichus eleginoides TaxID=100907 RepID=A0AAD9EQN5_DISEL|nr:Pre-mRNA cleavage complex 2 protein Pcf11 [Dissostichus eleginoides]
MADKDACREYLSSLEDLTFNSKPHINMLTILAEENLHFAKEIVAIIEAQISKALSAEKLPVLYLVDSIVKNVGGEYLAVFAKNLITSFYVSLKRWMRTPGRASSSCAPPGRTVNSVDPAWPIKALPPSVSNASIHVNPKFLKQVTPVPPSSLTQESLIPQLMGGFVMPPAVPVKPGPPAAPGVRPWLPPPQPDPKPPTRDPRLNRAAGTPTGKKEGHAHTGSAAVTPEKPPRPEKPRTPRKEAPKPPTTISSSPITKSVPMKPKPAENETKKDPRLKKRGGGAVKEEELKKKKEEPLRGGGNKGKLLNGSKHDEEKMEFKAGGNARTHRKERRRTRSSSLSRPPPHKPGKPPRRETRTRQKKSQSESRRSKRPVEDPPHPPHSPRGHDGAKEGKDGPAPPHRWRSGWEENKHPKPEDPHLKPATPVTNPNSAPPPPTPRTPKHRLSVDANMQIPEVLNSASKKDLLRRASKRLESGEISQEDFLNMAHQIKHFFQYQEEKQRPDSWDPLSGLPRPTLTSGAPRPPLTSGARDPPLLPWTPPSCRTTNTS